MACFTRTISFNAVQFNEQTLENAHDFNANNDLEDLIIYDSNLERVTVLGDSWNLNMETVLVVTQYHLNEEGERSNLQHRLRHGDWLMEDAEAEGGYRVISDAGFRSLAGLTEV